MVRPTIELRTVAITQAQSVVPVEDGDNAEWITSPIGDPSEVWTTVVAATTGSNIDLGTDLEDGDTLDGVTLAEGDLVLVKDQTNAFENGIYEVSDTGLAARAAVMDESDEVVGVIVLVAEGTANAGTRWMTTNTTPPIIDTDDILFTEWADSAGGGSRPLGVTFDGGAAAPTAGAFADLFAEATGTITLARMVADRTGSAVIDVWITDYASGPPTDSDSITSATPPTLSSEETSEDSTLSGWSTAVTQGDWIRFHLDSASTLFRVTLQLSYE